MGMGWRLGLAVLLAVAVAFGIGYLVGADRATHLSIYTADGYVGADQASFMVGDVTYGFRSTVAWTDQAGVQYDHGWPACLPKLQQVTGVRFAAAVLWHGDSGLGTITWVDCQVH
jgi:hypothetical protein